MADQVLRGDGKAIFIVFVGALIAVVFMGIIGTQVVNHTQTFSVTNATVTTSTSANGTTAILGRTLVGNVTITNATDGTLLNERNVTMDTIIDTDGLFTVAVVTLNATLYGGQPVNVSYTYQPDGYLNLVGARGITILILIMSALAIVVFVIVVFIKNGSLGTLMRR